MKRYLQEKIAFIQSERARDEHVLIVPGAANECISSERSRIYTIRAPLVSRSSRYRALIDLRAVDEIIERERPDIIESADPYQLGWKALRAGGMRRIPVVAFYHSHFVEAYLRGPAQRFGPVAAHWLLSAARAYVRNLYNRFEVTFVPSEPLAEVLRELGVRNTRVVSLGVNTRIFRPANNGSATRLTLGIPGERKLLLYVGRLAPEKNARVLFETFALLAERWPGRFHLLVVGDGPQGADLRELEVACGNVSWIPYCNDSQQLAQYYRAADLFVHPGLEETFGLVALESQACGTPVLGIRGSYMDRVIFHDQQEWAEENSAQALAAAVTKFSLQTLSDLGERAARRVQVEYSWPHVFARLFSFYEEIIDRSPVYQRPKPNKFLIVTRKKS